MNTTTRAAALTLLLGCGACNQHASARAPAARPARPAPAQTTTEAPLRPSAAPSTTAAPARAEPFRVDRVAALSPSKVLAVSRGALWRTEGGRWVELPVAGAELRDVSAGAGSLWVLARGVGPNAGRVMVLRSSGGDDLAVAADFFTSPQHDPRALAIVSDHEFFLGGANPALVRSRGGAMSTVPMPSSPIESLTYMPDEMMAVRYGDGTVTVYRWGETARVERPSYRFSFAGVHESLMVLNDGAVWRGRVWEQPLETDRLSGASGIVPLFAAVLRDQRVVEAAADGRTRLLQDGRWVDLEAPEPPDGAAALLGARSLTEGLALLVDRRGAVFELVGTRWHPRVPSPDPR